MPVGYPWDSWADGETHVVKRGVDYRGKTPNFIGCLKWHGRRLGQKPEITQIDEETVQFKFAPAATSPEE